MALLSAGASIRLLRTLASLPSDIYWACFCLRLPAKVALQCVSLQVILIACCCCIRFVYGMMWFVYIHTLLRMALWSKYKLLHVSQLLVILQIWQGFWGPTDPVTATNQCTVPVMEWLVQFLKFKDQLEPTDLATAPLRHGCRWVTSPRHNMEKIACLNPFTAKAVTLWYRLYRPKKQC